MSFRDVTGSAAGADLTPPTLAPTAPWLVSMASRAAEVLFSVIAPVGHCPRMGFPTTMPSSVKAVKRLLLVWMQRKIEIFGECAAPRKSG